MAPGTMTVEELQQRITDLRARLPQHSIPATMWLELEELEDALAAANGAQETGRRAEDRSLAVITEN